MGLIEEREKLKLAKSLSESLEEISLDPTVEPDHVLESCLPDNLLALPDLHFDGESSSLHFLSGHDTEWPPDLVNPPVAQHVLDFSIVVRGVSPLPVELRVEGIAEFKDLDLKSARSSTAIAELGLNLKRPILTDSCSSTTSVRVLSKASGLCGVGNGDDSKDENDTFHFSLLSNLAPLLYRERRLENCLVRI